MSANLLVAGIGNIFLGDDAFGVAVVQRLAERALPEGVIVKDFGIRSYDLAYALMEEWDLAILVDALPRGAQPGTIYTVEPEMAETGQTQVAPDAHSMNPVAVLQLVKAMGGAPSRLLVVGCEPAGVEPDAEGKIGLSEAVSAAVPEAIRVIEELIFRERSQITAA
jgi:hydrogenase maturation protease